MTSRFFKSPAEFRRWLAKHHASADELSVGFYRTTSGKASITWPESVDQALCFGWIDGVRKRVDEESYTIRFSPRKLGSNWSAVNVRRARQLADQGSMQPAGQRAFDARTEKKSAVYSYEQERPPELDGAYARKFKKNKAAWEFFQAQPASHRKKASWWVMSAKKEPTRLARLGKLIEDAARGRRS